MAGGMKTIQGKRGSGSSTQRIQGSGAGTRVSGGGGMKPAQGQGGKQTGVKISGC